jgi:hypothetical protein
VPTRRRRRLVSDGDVRGNDLAQTRAVDVVHAGTRAARGGRRR